MKRFLMALAGLILILAGLFAGLAREPLQAAHLVFLNGDIRTLAGAGTVEALYVRNGRVAAAGSRAEVFAAAPFLARRIDLEGGTLTPGLIEPHTHPLATALLDAAIDISGLRFDSRDAVMDRLAEAVEEGGPSPWLIAFGWDPVMLDGMTPPSLAELDALSPERPMVILTQMMHEAFANSAALAAAGITADTPDPADGHFERDAAGALTGRAVEVSAVRQIMAGVSEPSDAALVYLLSGAYDRYAQAGYTTIGIASLVGRARDPLAVLERVAATERPVLNTVLYTAPGNWARGRHLFDDTDNRDALRRVAGMKVWIDGSPFTGGAATAEPYADTPLTRDVLGLEAGWSAPLATTPDAANALALAAQAQGVQMVFHVQGERAVDVALDAIAAAQAAHPGIATRHRLEHLALITPQQIDRAREMDVTLGFFPDHIGNYGHRLDALFGAGRAARYMPVADAVERGAIVTLHGDHPASDIDALRVMALPVTRATRDGTALGDPVPAETALELMTLGAARQLQLEQEIGSLEPGKRADLTWFDRDPVTAIEAGETATVRGTWVAGRRIDTRPWTWHRIRLALAAAWGQLTGG